MGIALFGGAFDPFHNGHVAIVKYLETLPYINQILIIPTHIPPHKPSPFFSPEQRQHMAETMAHSLTRNIPIHVSDIELKKQTPSWTIDTLKTLKSQFPNKPYYIVIGSDNYFTFHTWKSPEEILTLSKIIVINREDYEDSFSLYLEAQFPLFSDQFIFTQMEKVAISSQLIRTKLKNNESIIGLVPDLIEKRIETSIQ